MFGFLCLLSDSGVFSGQDIKKPACAACLIADNRGEPSEPCKKYSRMTEIKLCTFSILALGLITLLDRCKGLIKYDACMSVILNMFTFMKGFLELS